MRKWAMLHLALAIVAGVVGFAAIGGAAAGVAQLLSFLFLAVCVLLLVVDLAEGV